MESQTVPRQIQEGVPALHAATVCEAFQRTAAEHADRVALRTPDDGVSMTYREYAERVRDVAAGLAALGVGRGHTVAIMLTNRPEFNVVDMAAVHLGATPFSVYNTSSPEQIEHVFTNAENRVVIAETQFVERIHAARTPALEHVVCIDGAPEGTVSLDDVVAGGDPGFDFDGAWRAVTPEDVLTLIYTSGTTGPPKGVELTHGGIMAESRGCSSMLPGTVGGAIMSYLPSAHIADRWTQHYYGTTCFGATVTFVADAKQLVPALAGARPTMWGGVPRIWEKLMAALQAQGMTDPSAVPEEMRHGVLAKLGLDRVQWSICGAAPIAVEVLEYFGELGLPIQELWGMSELSCCVTINPADDIRPGTVGVAIPGMEVALADDGELLCRGPLVMKGYRNDPEKTAEAIDGDGWLHTGDIAEIDGDGYVKIVDRKKELIINAGGKNMSPANIEQRLKASSPLIGQAIAIGDRRPYNVALLVLDPDAAAAYASEHGLADGSTATVAADERVREAIGAAVQEANEHLSRVEQIKRFELLDVDWEPGGEELTPTMKLKRKPIAAKYAERIEALYAES